MRMILTQTRQQGYAPGHYPGSLRWPNYLPQMYSLILCNEDVLLRLAQSVVQEYHQKCILHIRCGHRPCCHGNRLLFSKHVFWERDSRVALDVLHLDQGPGPVVYHLVHLVTLWTGVCVCVCGVVRNEVCWSTVNACSWDNHVMIDRCTSNFCLRVNSLLLPLGDDQTVVESKEVERCLL